MLQQKRKQGIFFSKSSGIMKEKKACNREPVAVHQMKTSDFRSVSNIKRKSAGSRIVQRALAVNEQADPIGDGEHKSVHWVVAENGFLRKGENHCREKCKKLAGIGRAGSEYTSMEPNGAKIWLRLKRVPQDDGNATYRLIGYVIRHKHHTNVAGYLGLGNYMIHATESNRKIEKVIKGKGNCKEVSGTPGIAIEHYHGANKQYIMEHYADSKYKGEHSVSIKENFRPKEVVVEELAKSILDNTHGETGHHVFDSHTLLASTPAQS